MLQAAPITAPGRTWANAQMRVPAPIEGLSTIAVSCWKKPPSANGDLLFEGLQRANHGGDFLVLQFGITRQGQNFAGGLLGHRQLGGGRRPSACRLLEVIRHGVVAIGGDAVSL